jgi:hypothetical protein
MTSMVNFDGKRIFACAISSVFIDDIQGKATDIHVFSLPEQDLGPPNCRGKFGERLGETRSLLRGKHGKTIEEGDEYLRQVVH